LVLGISEAKKSKLSRASPAVKIWTIAVQEASGVLLRVKLSVTRMRNGLTCHGNYNTSYLDVKESC